MLDYSGFSISSQAVGHFINVSVVISPQGFMPETLPVSCCHSAPDFHISSPAKSFFKKAAAALFGGKKDKAKYYENISKFLL